MEILKYKLINNKTNEEHFCDKVTIDGFEYYYIDELIPYNPNGGTNGNFICLSEIKSNKEHNVKLSDKMYVSPFVKNVGSCGGCRKLIATNNPNIDIPKIVDEVEKLFTKISKNPPYTEIINKNAVLGYNKSQETHPFSEEHIREAIKFGKEIQKGQHGNVLIEDFIQDLKQIKTLYYENKDI